MVLEQKVLKYKGQIVFEKIAMQPTFNRTPKLYQQNEACFIFINEGEFSVRTPDQYHSLKKGSGLLAKCFDWFFEINQKQKSINDGKIEVLGILLFPSIVEELFQFNIASSTHRINYNTKKIEVDRLLFNFKESINILLDNPELADEELIKMKLKEFILLITKTTNAPSQLDFLSAIFRKTETDFRATITNNMYSNLSVDEFSKLCAMSVSSFKRKFKEIFNDSPKRYLGKMKLEKSIKMLESKDTRISDIAYDCGFETISTFNRSFKTQYGKSPSEYRLSQIA